MEINLAEPGSGKGNGNEQLGTGGNGIEQYMSVHLASFLLCTSCTILIIIIIATYE